LCFCFIFALENNTSRNMTVEEKIGILVERYCRNRSHLAAMIKVSPQAVNNWVYRDHIPRKGIEAIMARFPQLDIEWLRGDNAPLPSGSLPLPDEDNDENETLLFNTKSDTRPDAQELIADIPMPEKMPALFVSGVLPSQGDVPQHEIQEGLVPLKMPRQDIKYVFQCHGDSMLPRIQDGDYVGVGEALGRYEEFRKGTPYLVQTTDGRLMVKMVEDPGPSSPFLLLSTENPKYQLADGGRLAKSEFRAAYRVIMVMRDI
jgi:phage repressor protein C with HTH and peptisase S24 domain